MRALYTAATGMTAQQMRIDNIANNLSNVSTTGYKKAREAFEDLVYQNMPVGSKDSEQPRPSSLQIGTGTRLVAVNRDFSPGEMTYSGGQFDLAIAGQGFFQVLGPGGDERYTRDGHFQKNADGELVTPSGLALQPGIQIPDEATQVTISEDGTVQVAFDGETELTTVGEIQLYNFINPTGLRGEGGNLFMPTAESGEADLMDTSDGLGRVQQGFLEASNVDVAEELISMIVAQRAFELTSKVVQTADETLQTVNQLKR